MASFKELTDKNGSIYYKVQVSAGRGRKVTRNWRPADGWSAKTIERELNKYAASLENDLAAGTLETRKERLDRERIAALEDAKLKTLRQYVENIYMPTKETSFSENARSSYQQNLDNHILPVLGDFLMTDITPAMLKNLLTSFQKKGYAHATAVKLYMILNGIFKMALLDDTITFNPMMKVERPKPRKSDPRPEEQEKAYTVSELRYILQCLEDEPLKWKTYINLVLDSGIRRGEACGLQWGDIDFQHGSITIRRNLQYTPQKGIYLDTPKNGKTRNVDVGPETLALLRELRTEQSQTAISPFVFTQDASPDPMHPQSPTRYFAKFGKRHGINGFHPHKLRHTNASIAITNGADIVSVSERLGHSDTAVTLCMYAHANEESMRRAGQIVRDALKEAK